MKVKRRESTMSMTRRTYKRAWIGFAAAAIMSLIGPRPLFVKTAYADTPTPQLDELVASGVDAGIVELFEFDVRD